MKAPRWPVVLSFCTAVIVASQKGVIAGQPGNYLRFHDTFYRLIEGRSIYYPPAGEITGFLYSPIFALLFAPFAVLPAPLGLVAWNAVNALALCYGLTQLLPPRAAAVALAIVFLDLLRALQNFQSNALVVGLLLATFLAIERRREAAAAGTTLLGAAIKIFPLAAGLFGLLSPRRWRFILWSLVIAVALFALPLTVLSPAAFMQVYRDWLAILMRDTGLQGQSVMRILSDWFGFAVPNWTIQLAGTLLLLAPLAARRSYLDRASFRLRFLCSLLVYLVIFNHQAESSSFVIATTGVAIWYVTTPRAWWRTVLLLLTLLGVSVPRLFFFPYHTYHDLIQAHALDAFPCLLVWLAMQIDLWTWPRSELPHTEHSKSPRNPSHLTGSRDTRINGDAGCARGGEHRLPDPGQDVAVTVQVGDGHRCRTGAWADRCNRIGKSRGVGEERRGGDVPAVCASRMPRFTPAESPKSSV